MSKQSNRLYKNVNIRKVSLAVILLNVLLTAAVVAAAVFGPSYEGIVAGRRFDNLDILFLAAIAVVIANSLITIRDKYLIGRVETEYRIFRETLAQAESLNNTLRAQRHDFMNHLQVVYSLMEMDAYMEAKDYIEKIYTDIQKVGRSLKTANPAINALLRAKMLACEKYAIRFELSVTSPLKELSVPDWELCRVFGNLIDNAIHALRQNKGGTIWMEIWEDISTHRFRVANDGPPIENAQLGHIFKPGYTTKGKEGEGMGLAIVRETLEAYGGSIRVDNGSGKTVFEGAVPKSTAGSI